MPQLMARFASIKFTILGMALILALGAGLLAYGSTAAQQPTPSDDQVNAVAHELYCPVCENIPLDVCPTTACAQWRELIREKLAAGWDKQRIEAYFAAQYGDRVLAVPPFQRTFNLILPGLIGGGILLALGIVIWVLRGSLRRSQTEKNAPAPSPDELPGVDEEYLRRIEKDLRQRS
jgi:cytochrome c-type biogenesis protein CcmH